MTARQRIQVPPPCSTADKAGGRRSAHLWRHRTQARVMRLRESLSSTDSSKLFVRLSTKKLGAVRLPLRDGMMSGILRVVLAVEVRDPRRWRDELRGGPCTRDVFPRRVTMEMQREERDKRRTVDGWIFSIGVGGGACEREQIGRVLRFAPCREKDLPPKSGTSRTSGPAE